MNKASIDIETYSECDLKKCGAAVYGEHPSTEILCMSWAINGGEVSTWLPGDELPDFLVNPEQYTFCAWNAAFEYAVMRWYFENLPPLHEWSDTMLRAIAVALPQHLGNCADALGMAEKKDKGGTKLISKYCVPQKDGSRIACTGTELKKLVSYCEQDVRTERAIGLKVPEIAIGEQETYRTAFKINQRGVLIDIESCERLTELYTPYQDELKATLNKLTGLKNANSNVQFKLWLHENGVPVDNCQAKTLSELTGLPPNVSESVKLKQAISKNVLNKYKGMTSHAMTDNRVRDSFTYHGAHTGRFSSRGINVQNLHRPIEKVKKNPQLALDMVLTSDIGTVEENYGDYGDVVSSLERSMIIAPDGKELGVVDYSSIEAVTLSWLAGAADNLKIFATHGKIYEATAAKMYDVRLDDVESDQRFLGKVATLALGYQGGVGAFKSMAAIYGSEVTDEFADEVKTDWRDANPEITAYWYKVQEAAHTAIKNPGDVFRVSDKLPDVKFLHSDGRLLCQLPSRRTINYWAPKIVTKKVTKYDGESFDTQAIRYTGVDSRTRKWKHLHTYGGKLVENITQAVARDIFVHGLNTLERNDYDVVLQVHDEAVCELKPEQTLQKQIDLMLTLPKWAEKLPIGADGFTTMRYSK